MKISKEYVLIFVLGLFVLSYVLDSVVEPLSIDLVTPYHYLNPEVLIQYPFTSVSVFIKALGIFITPLWLFSFFDRRFMAKAVILFVFSSLIQLYALQDVFANSSALPLEWSISMAIAGAALLIPAVIFIFNGFFFSLRDNITTAKMEDAISKVQAEEKLDN